MRPPAGSRACSRSWLAEVRWHAWTASDTDVSPTAPIEADTIFRIHSMTKPITSVALMSLYEEGLFQLDDPASRFLPELAGLRVWEDGTPTSYRTTVAEREITVRDLLTHTAGFTYGFMLRHPIDALYRKVGVEGGKPWCPRRASHRSIWPR